MGDDSGAARDVVLAVLSGFVAVAAGTLPRNLIFLANLRYAATIPWAVPVSAAYLYVFWRYMGGRGLPESTARWRREALRANRISGRAWAWSLVAGSLAIVALVLALRVANRMVMLPQQYVADLSRIPRVTVWALLLMGAPIAGVVEESAFRGYMQAPIERRWGLPVAILITGTIFAFVHLDFRPILWPYYVAVSAIYGTVAYLTNSILPAIALHTCGNLYSNSLLLLYRQAEWQAAPSRAALIWRTGADRSFWEHVAALAAVTAAMAWAYAVLARERTKDAAGNSASGARTRAYS